VDPNMLTNVITLHAEMDTGRVDPRVGSGRVGSRQSLHGSDRVQKKWPAFSPEILHGFVVVTETMDENEPYQKPK